MDREKVGRDDILLCSIHKKSRKIIYRKKEKIKAKGRKKRKEIELNERKYNETFIFVVPEQNRAEIFILS